MVLVTGTDPRSIAEFLVMPQYRCLGVGLAAARYVFDLFGGAWSVHEVPGNDAAVAFWRRAIPVEFAESCDGDGTTQRFRMPT
jgi:predicted acetyltransferase